MKHYRFSLDDNILVFRDLAQKGCQSLFDHPYLAFLKEVHREFRSKIQLNLYYETEGFCLTQMPDRYREEWKENAKWLKLSFHARANDPPAPYEHSGYEEVFADCSAVQEEILRFAGEDSLSSYTTLHYCKATPAGVRALKDCGVRGLVGLFVPTKEGMVDYSLSKEAERYLQTHSFYRDEEYSMNFIRNDVVINLPPLVGLGRILAKRETGDFFEVMIHEQYFYKDSPLYQPDFRDKVRFVLKWLSDREYEPAFLEEILE